MAANFKEWWQGNGALQDCSFSVIAELSWNAATRLAEESQHVNQQRKGKIIAFDSLDRTVTVNLYAGCDGLVMGATAAITSPVA